jgi:hypothetical protein
MTAKGAFKETFSKRIKLIVLQELATTFFFAYALLSSLVVPSRPFALLLI